MHEPETKIEMEVIILQQTNRVHENQFIVLIEEFMKPFSHYR
jgi:hypothetical protein